VRCALDLERKIGNESAITLVDKKSYHLFVPALYEVASAYGVKRDPFAIRLKKTICIPYLDIFSGKKVNFIQAEVSAIDLENKKVATRGGEILGYDYLVIALGGQADDFDIPGVREYAFQFKDLEDALLLNKKIDELTKEVAEGRRERPIKIAVVGAGFTGIEIAAEFACCVKKFSRICGIKERCERVILLEAGPRILPAASDGERNVILKRLTRLGIEVLEGAAAEEIGSSYIKLKNGKHLDIDLVIWAAGIRFPDLLERTPALPLTEKPARGGSASGGKKIKVNNGLELVGVPGVFAVGDNTEFTDPKTNKPVSALAYVAVDQGKIAAKNILRLLDPAPFEQHFFGSFWLQLLKRCGVDNKKVVEYNPFYSVWIAPIGGKYAFAHLWGEFNVKGFLGWALREAVDFKYMLSILSVRKAISIMWQEITLFTKND